MTVLHRFLRFFFHHFYHRFAWTYDSVAAVVSIGRWNEWIKVALPYVAGSVLELGHGPGHLQVALHSAHVDLVAGLDESHQMGHLAAARLKREGFSRILTRGLAQSLPFANASFDIVVSTFPTEYIFEPHTLREIRRVLRTPGRLVVLPAAWIVGHQVLDRSAAWLFRATEQAPRVPAAILGERLRSGLESAGFRPKFETIAVRSSEVLVVVADI